MGHVARSRTGDSRNNRVVSPKQNRRKNHLSSGHYRGGEPVVSVPRAKRQGGAEPLDKGVAPSWIEEPVHFEPNRARVGVRTVWISDIHLGTPAATRRCCSISSSIECETLYLVGDIVDGWRLRKGWYWPTRTTTSSAACSRWRKHGTRVVYVPGNHDEMLRDYVGLNFGGVELVPEAIHETADGRRLLVLHGDKFDGVVLYAKWLAFLGDSAYVAAAASSTAWVNGVRRASGCPIGRCRRTSRRRSRTRSSSSRSFEEVVAHAAHRARRRRRRLRPHPLAPRSARSATSPITTTATGSRAAPRWSSISTADGDHRLGRAQSDRSESTAEAGGTGAK